MNRIILVTLSVIMAFIMSACGEASNPKWTKISELTPKEKEILSTANDSIDKINQKDSCNLSKNEIVSLLTVYPNLFKQLYKRGYLDIITNDDIVCILKENPGLSSTFDSYGLLEKLNGRNWIALAASNDKFDKLFKQKNIFIKVDGIEVVSSLQIDSNCLVIVEKYNLWKFLQKEDWLRMLTQSFSYSKYCKIWPNFSAEDWIRLLESDYQYRYFFKEVDAFRLFDDKKKLFDGISSNAFIDLLVDENHNLLNTFNNGYLHSQSNLFKKSDKYKEYFLKNHLYNSYSISDWEYFIIKNPSSIDYCKHLDDLNWSFILSKRPTLVSYFMKIKDWSKVYNLKELAKSIPEINTIYEIKESSADKLVDSINDPFVMNAIEKLKIWNKFSNKWDKILLMHPELIHKCKENNDWGRVKSETKALLLSKNQGIINEIEEKTWREFTPKAWGILLASNLSYLDKFYKYSPNVNDIIVTKDSLKEFLGYEATKKITDLWINKYFHKSKSQFVRYWISEYTYKDSLSKLEKYFIVKIISLCYFHGIGIDESKEMSFKVLEQASKTNSLTYIDLGYYYLNGIGVKKDIEEAIKYLEKGLKENPYIQKENSYIQFLLATCYAQKQDFNKFEEYANKAANAGNTEAMFTLGLEYYTGRLLTLNKQKGFDLIQKSAMQGNPNANSFLEALEALTIENKILHSHLSGLLGRLRVGDTSLLIHLGMYGIGGVHPTMSSSDLIRRISDALPSLDKNRQEALLNPLGFTELQKYMLENGMIELLYE